METMSEHRVALSDQESAYLLGLLEAALGEIRVEARRTRTPDFHERVLREEDLIRGLLAKLRQQGATDPIERR